MTAIFALEAKALAAKLVLYLLWDITDPRSREIWETSMAMFALCSAKAAGQKVIVLICR